MTTLIYYYIKKIIFFLVFTSFVQILFLNNKYKSYLQLVLSLILVFVMVEPLQNIYNSIRVGTLDEYIEIAEDADFDFSEEDYIEIQNDMILDLFKQNIKVQTEKIIGDEYKILDFDLVLVEDKSYQTLIKSIQITLSKEGEKMVYVKPFSFSTNEEDNNNENNDEIKELKKIISNFYNLSLENIFITIV